MKDRILSKKIQKGVAFTAMTTFLVMPANMACANNITAGSSAIGNQTGIVNNGNITNITSGFIQGGTGINHFGNFTVSQGGTANLLGAQRYINLVNERVNINGVLNAYQGAAGAPHANVMFISPKGMAIGSSGVLNVAGLQAVTPTSADYTSLINKGTALTPAEAYAVNAAIGGDDAVIEINGKIYSAGEVDLKAGSGIWFGSNGLIQTTGANSDISLFTNTGDIWGGGDKVNIDSSGNLTLTAKDGGIGSSLAVDPASYGEAENGSYVTPINVKVANGKNLNVEVADTVGATTSFKGKATVTNKTTNLNVGTLKGADVKINNASTGTLATTQDISGVGKLYLNAENGSLNVGHNLTANGNESLNGKSDIRLNGKKGVTATGNLTVDDGYISVYSSDGAINMNNATLGSGNIDINAKGDVNHGNVTIATRGPAEGMLRLVDNKTLSTGVEAPDLYRFDGVHITSRNGNIAQKANTQITSAGRVDLTAAGNVNNTVKSYDLITVSAGKDTNLTTVDTARLGVVEAKNINVNGLGSILVDDLVKGDSVNVQAADSVTIRPHEMLVDYGDNSIYTYGRLEGKNDVNVTSVNGGILATAARENSDMITSSAGNVNLVAAGDIVGTDSKIKVNAAGNTNAEANNINLALTNPNGNVGLINAIKNAGGEIGNVNIDAAGNMFISDRISGKDVTVNAAGDIRSKTNVSDITTNPDLSPDVISTGDMTLKSANSNVGAPGNLLIVQADGDLTAEAPNGRVYIGSGNDLKVKKALSKNEMVITTGGKLTVKDANVTEESLMLGGNDVDITKATAKKNTTINSTKNILVRDKVEATDGNLTVYARENIEQQTENPTQTAFKAGNDMTLTGKKSVGQNTQDLYVDVAGTLDARSEQGGVYIHNPSAKKITIIAHDDLNYGTVTAPNGVTLNSTSGSIKIGNAVTSTESGASISGYTGVDLGDADVNTKYITTVTSLGGDVTVGKLKSTYGDVTVAATGNVLVKDFVESGNNLTVTADGSIAQSVAEQVAFKSGNDMTLYSSHSNVGDPAKYLYVDAKGSLDAEAPNGGVYIYPPKAGKNLTIKAKHDVNLDDAVAQNGNATVQSYDGKVTVGSITATNGNITLTSNGKATVGTANAKNNINVTSTNGDILVKNKVDAGNNLTMHAKGSIEQEQSGKVSFKSGKNMSFTSDNANVGNPSTDPNKYLQVDVGGDLTAMAQHGGVYIGSPEDLNLFQVVGGNGVEIAGKKGVYQSETKGVQKPVIVTGRDLKISSETGDIGKEKNYLTVNVPGELTANADRGSIYIEGYPGNLRVKNVTAAQGNVGLKADGNITQVDGFDFDNPTIVAGKNMNLSSTKGNVGDPSNYLSVSVGGELGGNGSLTATAPKGGVYIGSKNNLVIDKVSAGKDVGIESDGFIHQKTPGGARPAITSGGDMHLVSNHDNVGDPDDYLTVRVGGGLDAAAPEGGVYIYGYGNLKTDSIVAGDDVGIKGTNNIIIPHDTDDGNIIAGGDVEIKAGGSVLNGGGEGKGIDAGGDITILANLNGDNPPGSIGILPYNDLTKSINVTLGGDATVDEVGVAPGSKILNINIMNPKKTSSDDTLNIDDRDQKMLNVLTDGQADDGSVNGRHNRQHLRYNVASSEYVLMNSSTDSGAKVQDVLNISKQGMLVQTDSLPQIGENVSITMDYKGLPFTVDGKVVRTDKAHNTAGIQFNNIDQFTSSMILYLGMMNGKQ